MLEKQKFEEFVMSEKKLTEHSVPDTEAQGRSTALPKEEPTKTIEEIARPSSKEPSKRIDTSSDLEGNVVSPQRVDQSTETESDLEQSNLTNRASRARVDNPTSNGTEPASRTEVDVPAFLTRRKRSISGEATATSNTRAERATRAAQTQDTESPSIKEATQSQALANPTTREERRKLTQGEKGSGKVKREKKGRIRLIPVWLKVIVAIGLFTLSLALGLMFGYGIIGDGEPRDALDLDTWYRIYDLIFDDTELDRDIRGFGN